MIGAGMSLASASLLQRYALDLVLCLGTNKRSYGTQPTLKHYANLAPDGRGSCSTGEGSSGRFREILLWSVDRPSHMHCITNE